MAHCARTVRLTCVPHHKHPVIEGCSALSVVENPPRIELEATLVCLDGYTDRRQGHGIHQCRLVARGHIL